MSSPCVELFQALTRARDQVAVVGTLAVEPENGRLPRGARAVDGQLDPVANRHVPGLAHAPDIALANLVLRDHFAAGVDHAHGAGVGHLEGLVVRTVFLCRLCHQANVADIAHGGDVIGAQGAAVVDDRLVDARVAAVRESLPPCHAACRPVPTFFRRRGSPPASTHR